MALQNAFDPAASPVKIQRDACDIHRSITTGDQKFSILAAAPSYINGHMPGTGRAQTLAELSSDLTVFAPTNAAFGPSAADLGFSGDPADSAEETQFIVGALRAATIRDVILYYVSVGTQTAQHIGCACTIVTSLGPTIILVDMLLSLFIITFR